MVKENSNKWIGIVKRYLFWEKEKRNWDTFDYMNKEILVLWIFFNPIPYEKIWDAPRV